jgi:hypothetical protein
MENNNNIIRIRDRIVIQWGITNLGKVLLVKEVIAKIIQNPRMAGIFIVGLAELLHSLLLHFTIWTV